jgi:hypothetical protein
VNRIDHLWRASLTQEMVVMAQGDLFGARVRADTPGAISVMTDLSSSWSSEQHLKYRGSTHNVYLDWYYYVGLGPLLVFVSVILCFLGALCIHLWRNRAAPHLPFLLATTLQVVVLFGLMYAQPNIWIKYFWFVFGIASGLMINRSVQVAGKGVSR